MHMLCMYTYSPFQSVSGLVGGVMLILNLSYLHHHPLHNVTFSAPPEDRWGFGCQLFTGMFHGDLSPRVLALTPNWGLMSYKSIPSLHPLKEIAHTVSHTQHFLLSCQSRLAMEISFR